MKKQGTRNKQTCHGQHPQRMGNMGKQSGSYTTLLGMETV